jgi:hypothetical protein
MKFKAYIIPSSLLINLEMFFSEILFGPLESFEINRLAEIHRPEQRVKS